MAEAPNVFWWENFLLCLLLALSIPRKRKYILLEWLGLLQVAEVSPNPMFGPNLQSSEDLIYPYMVNGGPIFKKAQV